MLILAQGLLYPATQQAFCFVSALNSDDLQIDLSPVRLQRAVEIILVYAMSVITDSTAVP